MVVTKAKTVTVAKKNSSHPTYESMIVTAVNDLKERQGSSRLAVKKYILANNDVAPGSHFDSQISAAIKRGVAKDVFVLPKGMSGTIKLVKPEKKVVEKKTTNKKKADVKKVEKKTQSKKTPTKKEAVKKVDSKRAATKKAVPKKDDTHKANDAHKKTTASKKAAVSKKPTSKKPTAKKIVEKENLKAPSKLTKRQSAMKAASASTA